jgi:hypothetical protein
MFMVFCVVLCDLAYISVATLFQANSEAAVGKYAGGVAGAAGGQSLFVAGHAY